MKDIVLIEEETLFLKALLQHQADFYLHISQDKALAVLSNQRICNELLFKLEY